MERFEANEVMRLLLFDSKRLSKRCEEETIGTLIAQVLQRGFCIVSVSVLCKDKIFLI